MASTSRGRRALAGWLRERNWETADLARELGVDYARVWRLLDGERGPSLDLAVAIERTTGGAVPVEAWAKRTA